MATNYEQATIEPTNLPKKMFTVEDLEILESSGIERSEEGNGYYFFVPEGLCEDGVHARSYIDVFQDVIRRSKPPVEEIVIQGAFSGSKMRAGEFGGFVIRITEDGIQSGTSDDILELFRNGGWPLDRSTP